MKPLSRGSKYIIGVILALTGLILFEIYMPTEWRYREEIAKTEAVAAKFETYRTKYGRYPHEKETEVLRTLGAGTDSDIAYGDSDGKPTLYFTPDFNSYGYYDLTTKKWSFSIDD